MARSKKRLLGHWNTEDGGTVWVYKAGNSFWISHGNREHLCHPSIVSVDDTLREAVLVFHVEPTDFRWAD